MKQWFKQAKLFWNGTTEYRCSVAFQLFIKLLKTEV